MVLGAARDEDDDEDEDDLTGASPSLTNCWEFTTAPAFGCGLVVRVVDFSGASPSFEN